MSNELEVELNQLKEAFKVTAAKLMVANQTVHELLKGHMDLRAALTIAQNEKAGLDAYIKELLNTKPEQPTETTEPAQEAPAEPVAPVDAPVAAPVDAPVDAPVASENADTVST